MEISFDKEEFRKYANFLGMGFYRASREGYFIECDETARQIFGIPLEAKNLSKHSIKKLYVVPAEREFRMRKLEEQNGKPLSNTLSVRINGKNMLLFDICWIDNTIEDEGNIVGVTKKIEDSTIFPTMFDNFPMGLYETDDQNRLVRVNEKMVEILKYNSAEEMIGRPIKEFYRNEKDMEEYIAKIKENEKGFASDTLKLRDANNKTIEVESFTQDINKFKMARWGMVHDVTKRERYYRALDRMPTGFYHIENEKVIQCNDQFARILGFNKMEEAIGIDTRDFFVDNAKKKEYFEDLEKADLENRAVHNYEIDIKRNNDKRIVTISVDSHLIKDSDGVVLGREGTIRDISKEVKLKNTVKKTRERLNKLTADINKLIHTLLHPVVKFSGNVELLKQIGINLYHVAQPVTPPIEMDNKYENLNDLAIKLEKAINLLIKKMPEIDLVKVAPEKKISSYNGDLPAISTLKSSLKQLSNSLNYSIQSEKSDVLLDSAVKDTALWVLEELNHLFEKSSPKLKALIGLDFIEFLKEILFKDLIQTATILFSETHIMKRNVEALRIYISLQTERKFSLKMHDLKKILEENIKRFQPVLLQKGISIDYKCSGNLECEISQPDIDRVICNLFHNAQKYSHRGPGRFVKIRAKELQDSNHNKEVEFFIESFGLPVEKEEIESGRIWEFGYRGKHAITSDRDGTGVGLADAKDVIKGHNGTINLTSELVPDKGKIPGKKVSYLTKVTIKIPKHRKE